MDKMPNATICLLKIVNGFKGIQDKMPNTYCKMHNGPIANAYVQ